MKDQKLLLIYPRLGSGDDFIRDIPLSLIYAATHSVQAGINVELLDLRLISEKSWKAAVKEKVQDAFLVGVSVMTGSPIYNALEVSRFVKTISNAQVVWGGPHCTVAPDITIKEECIDFVVRWSGSETLCELAERLLNGDSSFEGIPNLSYKGKGKTYHNPLRHGIEMLPLNAIPYDLADCFEPSYSRFGQSKRVIPIFTSMGCPHRCTFCMSPVQYGHVLKKWIGYPPADVVKHIKSLTARYGADYISIYDDDAFVDLPRMRSILKAIIELKLNITIGFRGTRIDEIDRMDDAFLELMQDVGVTHLQVGLESGSQRILDFLKKDINIDQVARVNKKLSRYPKLKPIYNLFCGVPGETIDDLKKTKSLMLKLIKDNPHCMVGFPANYKPIPGSELFDISVENGLKPPKNLSDWGEYDSSRPDIYFPWYTKPYNKYIKLLQLTSYFIDDKILKELNSTSLMNKLILLISRMYKPVAKLRLENDVSGFFFEYSLFKIMKKRFV